MKTSLVLICGSALVTVGTVGSVLVGGQTQIVSSGTMSMGETTTQETPPSTPDTAVAQPAVKAGG